MKNLQEIMNEMSNLSEQIAVTLNDEEIKVNLEVEQPAEESVMQQDLAIAAAACSEASTISRNVPFCCATNLPTAFHFNPTAPRILYNLSCLKVIVEPCTTTVPVPGITGGCPFTAYNVRIVGCIPFIANATIPIEDSCFRPASPTTPFAICCSGSVCVNNIVCRKCNESDAIAAQTIVQSKLANCSCVDATISASRGSGTSSCVVTFTGNFSLPNCNASVTGNCNP